MATDVNVQESWTIEPELAETPPRRIAPSGYPDLNKPNALLFHGVGAALIIAGLVLLALGLARGAPVYTFMGVFLTLVGMIVAVLVVPSLVRRHVTRVRHLAENGVPVIARVLSADNMSGDNSFGRLVKFQATTPNGELTHRTSYADDRLLPRKIPANVTALLDINTGDVELYCALPFRAVPKTAGPVASPGITLPGGFKATPSASAEQQPQAAQTPGAMGTLSMGSLPPRSAPAAPPPAPAPEPKPQPKQEAPQEQTQSQEQKQSSAPAGLPWE